MPIEVRQMVIQSTVEAPVGRGREGEADGPPAGPDLERFKREILEECRAWFEERRRLDRER